MEGNRFELSVKLMVGYTVLLLVLGGLTAITFTPVPDVCHCEKVPEPVYDKRIQNLVHEIIKNDDIRSIMYENLDDLNNWRPLTF